MNHSQIVALANAIQTIRPDWQQPGIVAQLKTLHETWESTDGAMSAHVMAVAANPAAKTPGAFNAVPPANVAVVKPSWSEHICDICGDPESVCHRRRQWEASRGLEWHDFQTVEQAVSNRARKLSQHG